MTDERDKSDDGYFVINRRDFLQVSLASAVFAPSVLEDYSEAREAMSQADVPPSEEAVDLRPPPTERRDYFPLESELVSIRGLSPPETTDYPQLGPNSDTQTATVSSALSPDQNEVWVDDETLSLRNLAAWRSNSDPEAVFDQGFPNSARELITPQGEEGLEVFPDQTGWENWLGDFKNDEAGKLNISSQSELIQIIGAATRNETRFRAVGSGHSHSNAAAPENWFTDLKSAAGDTAGSATLDQNWLRSPADSFWDEYDIERDHLLRLSAGTVLRTLNREVLANRNLGLPNMGAWDGQTLAGAINTSTHGTGLNLGTFADLVRSVEIVCVPESQYQDGAPYVRALRIEPSNGITDPEKFAEDMDTHDMELIQNDDLFHSVVVGYGCMGIAHAYTLEMRDFYWLREETTLMTWDALKEELSPSEDETRAEAVENFVTKGDTRHFQFQMSLAEVQWQSGARSIPFDEHEITPEKNNPICLIRRHYELEDHEIPDVPNNWESIVLAWSQQTGSGLAANDPRWPPERRARTAQATVRNWAADIHPLQRNDRRAKQLHNNYFHPRAEDAPFVGERYETAWYIALRRLRDKNESTPQPPPDPATTTEVGVPLEELVDAVETIMEKVNDIKQEYALEDKVADGEDLDVFFFAPMGVRFTDGSPHFLSPEFGRKTAMLEVPMPVNDGKTRATDATGVPTLTRKELRDWVAEPALEKIEDPLVQEFDGRPHLGKHNTVNANIPPNSSKNHMRPQNMYPEYEKWLDAYRYLNRFGTFDGSFSEEKTA